MILGRVGGEGERHSPSLESEAALKGLVELHVPAKENVAKVFSGSLDPGKFQRRRMTQKYFPGR